MAYVVTETCLDSKFTKCVDVCPVDAFREGPDMLYIDPDVCIDCNACVSACPVRAIHPEASVPAELSGAIALNALMSKQYPIISESHDDDAPTTATKAVVNTSNPRRQIAVVGAGPSGFFATEELLKQLPSATVDIFERLPTPHGLVRYGVAPDHPKIKSVSMGFDKIAQLPNVRFFGNVQVGHDLSRSELLAHYDAVIYSTGGSLSRPFDLPGADADNILGSSSFVAWYNGHPDYRDLKVDLSSEKVAIVGIGNVALDIARILTLPVNELARTDIADHALEALRHSKVREVSLLSRRGPVQSAFTPKELQQLLDMPNVHVQVDPNDLMLDAASQAELDDPLNIEAHQNMALLHEAAARTARSDRIIRFIFKVSPTAFQATEGRVSAMTLAINTLEADSTGSVRALPCGESLDIPASLVCNATGYRGEAIPEVSFDTRRGVIANHEGRVLIAEGKISGHEYVAGWIKRGANGVVGSNKQCAVETVGHLVADQQNGAGNEALTARRDITALLQQKGVDFVSFGDWLALDAHEREQGREQDRPRRKVTEVAEMLRVIHVARAAKSQPAATPVSQATPVKISAASPDMTPSLTAEIKSHFRTCNLCEAMCGIKAQYVGERIISIAGDPDDPHSRGHICPKGYALQDLHNDPERLRTPMKRVGEHWIPIGWDEALQSVASRLVEIQQQYGNDAVGAYWGNPSAHNLGILLTLEGFRKALGSRNLFSASTLDQMPHQFVSYFMYGHNMLFTIPDIDRTDYMLMLGANPAASNGSLMSAGDILGRLEAITKRGGKIVLIDPRRTETAMYVSEHQFIQPGTDALFLLGLIQVIIARRLTKPGRLIELVTGWDELPAVLNIMPLERIAAITGIAVTDIERIAVEFATADKATCYGRMGVSTQAFGALNHWLIQLLNILTGNLDRPGGMMFTQPAMDMVSMNPRGSFDRYRSRVRQLPEFSGELPTAVIAEEMLTPGEGQIRAFVSVAGNPVLSSPNGRQLDEALAQLDFMVAIDFYLNETTRHAHIILPPTGPFEHEQYDLIFNTFAVRNFAKYAEPLFPHPPGTRSDFEIFSSLISQMKALKAASRPLHQRLKTRVMGELQQRLSPAHLVDLGLRLGPYGALTNPLRRLRSSSLMGLTLTKLKRHPHGLDLGPLRQVLPNRLHTRDKKIQLAPPLLVADLQRLRDTFAPETVGDELLLIGRRDLRTNNSWMHNSKRLVKGKDRCALFMHPVDAARLGIKERDQIRLASARGEIVTSVTVTADIKPGVVSLPHGWGHHRSGMRISTAQANPGVSINDVTDERVLDGLSGNAVLNGIPVRVLLAAG